MAAAELDGLAGQLARAASPDREAATKLALPPAERMPAMAWSPRVVSRPVTMMWAPFRARRAAVARPMPLSPPVTRVTHLEQVCSHDGEVFRRAVLDRR